MYKNRRRKIYVSIKRHTNKWKFNCKWKNHYGGGQVYAPNNPPKLTVSSRHIGTDTGGKGGTSFEYDYNFTRDANEVVSSVYLVGMGNGEYNNSAVWRLTSWSYTSSGIHIVANRNANDHSPNCRLNVTLVKISIS